MKAFVTALAGDDRIDLFEHLGEGELFLVDDHLARFDAGHIQDVIDDAEQMAGGGVDLAEVFLGFIIYLLIVHGDIVETDDRIHRCADLMRHIG